MTCDRGGEKRHCPNDTFPKPFIASTRYGEVGAGVLFRKISEQDSTGGEPALSFLFPPGVASRPSSDVSASSLPPGRTVSGLNQKSHRCVRGSGGPGGGVLGQGGLLLPGSRRTLSGTSLFSSLSSQ